jgi:hypothetical protein
MRVSALESEDNRIRWSVTLEFKAMANKTLYEFSIPTTANIRTGPAVDVGDNGFRLSLLWSTWCKPASFVERHMKMLVHISNTFWRSIALSLSRKYPRMPFYSAFSHSHSWGRQSSGSMPTKRETPHVIAAPLAS